MTTPDEVAKARDDFDALIREGDTRGGLTFFIGPQCLLNSTIQIIKAALSAPVREVREPTPEMLETLAKSFSPFMEGQSVAYLWWHFLNVCDKHNLKITGGGK